LYPGKQASKQQTDIFQRSSRGQNSYSGRNTNAPSPSELRRDLRRGFGAPRTDNGHQPASRNAISSSDLGTASNVGRPQLSTQQTRQSTQPLQSRASPTFETPDDETLNETMTDKLKNSVDFNSARDLLEQEMHRLDHIHPQDPRFHHDTSAAEINDIIIFLHADFCTNQDLLVDEDHSWLPAPGGYVQTKYRRAVVLDECSGSLKLGMLSTFLNMSMDEVRKQTVFDEVHNKEVLVLSDYVHIVAADHRGKSEYYPECFMDGVPVHYRDAPGCPPSSAKDSFMNPYTAYHMVNETPFMIVGHVTDLESVETLNMAVEATTVRTLKARAIASENAFEKARIKK